MKLLYPLIVLVSLSLALTKTSAQVNITTWQVDLQHTGNNANETILTPGNISSPGNFGLLFSQPMDGQTYGQPLIASGVNVSGTTRNLVYVATEHCSIYAFDGDTNLGPAANPIWHVSLMPAGTVPVPQSVVGSGDISVELGITTTPVIDLSTSTIYIVSKVQRTSDNTYHQYLYALDLATGTTKYNSPVEINPTFPGSSSDSSGGVIPFNPLREHLRSAMILHNNVVYLAYASHSDTNPYHGFVVGYDAQTLQVVKTFNTEPNSTNGGIWQSGAGPAIDANGNMFISVANGAFDQNNPQYGTNWGESFLKISLSGTGALGLNLYSNPLNWFTPNNYDALNGGDLDLGAGGLLLLPDQTGPHPHIMVGGGKGAVLYVVDRDNLGGLHTPDNAIQEIAEPNGNWIFTTPAYFNNFIYYSASGGFLEQRAVGYNPVDGSYIATTPITSADDFNGKGRGCFISSSGTTNGIVWLLTGGGVRAYNATNVSGSPIYSANSTLPGNIGTQSTKFSLPMVANGKLYYTAYDNTNTGYLLVSGLISSGSGTPAAPNNAVATPNSSTTITVTWTDNSDNESGFSVKRSTSATGPFTQVGAPGANVTAFTDTGLTPNTTYYYQVVAYNGNGGSAASNVASTATFPSYTENGLVAYWALDEQGGNTINDSTANGHTGTINGEAGITTGFINNCVEFHGTGQATSNITVASKADMQFAANQSFTLSAWVNPSALRNSEETIIAKSRDQGNYYGIWINASNQWVFRGPSGDVVGPAVTEGAWTHVAAVQDGTAGTRKLYINGTLVASGNAQAADGTGSLWIAQQNITGNFSSFPGSIDEVRLYSRPLASTEIKNLMGAPILAAASVQTQGNAGTFSALIWPSTSIGVEGRKGSPAGQYQLQLNFSAPVSGITATLGLQGGGTAVGSVSNLSYDSTHQVVTVTLTGVGNVQALNLHLAGILPGNGTMDIPFNILWGDANRDGIVNALDLSVVQNSHTAVVNSTSAFYDINCDGAVNATDDSLVSAAMGTNVGTQSDTNMALFQPTVASTSLGGNVPANAVDTDTVNSRWESVHGAPADPSWIYVDLGSISTIHTVVLKWEDAAGQNYTIDVCSYDPSIPSNWTTIKTVTGNSTPGVKTYSGLNAVGRYVRMYGTTRDSVYGYSLYDFQVIGLSGIGAAPYPTITGALTVSGTVGSPFSYQIAASNSPTSYGASGLPAGLGVNTATGLISGMPTTVGSTNAMISAMNASGTGSATLTVNVGPANPPPVITSGSVISGTIGNALNYQITASNGPTSFNATGLPSGLSVNTATGLISGTTTSAGSTTATISASNSNGIGYGSLAIAVSAVADINLALSKSGAASSVNPNSGNTAAMAFDGNTGTRWESVQGAAADPSWLYVDLGQVDTIHSVVINWENAAGKDYTIDICSGDPTVPGNWSTIQTVTNNTTAGVHTYSGFNVTARYVRMYGTTRTSIYGYSILEMQVFGLVGLQTPAITSTLVISGTTGSPSNYQITATNNPTSFSATPPAGLSINTATGLISGTTAATGTFSFPISAINTSGTGSAVLQITVQPSYAGWKSRVFTSGQLADPTISGDQATPAGDGITNLMKYALNLNPMTNGAAGLPVSGVTVENGVSYLTLTYKRLLQASDVTYTVEVSGDLHTWNSGSSYTAEVSAVNSGDGVTQTVVVKDLTPLGNSSAKRFIHLKVSKP